MFLIKTLHSLLLKPKYNIELVPLGTGIKKKKKKERKEGREGGRKGGREDPREDG